MFRPKEGLGIYTFLFKYDLNKAFYKFLNSTQQCFQMLILPFYYYKRNILKPKGVRRKPVKTEFYSVLFSLLIFANCVSQSTLGRYIVLHAVCVSSSNAHVLYSIRFGFEEQ